MDPWIGYRDDRGERLTTGPLRTRRAARRAGYDENTIGLAMREAERSAKRHAFGAMVGTLIYVIVVMQVIPWPPYGLGMAVALWAGVMGTVWLAGALPLPTKRLHRSGWLDLALCPACGYSLAELEPEEDNCRVCPECGGAWKLDDSVEGSPR